MTKTFTDISSDDVPLAQLKKKVTAISSDDVPLAQLKKKVTVKKEDTGIVNNNILISKDYINDFTKHIPRITADGKYKINFYTETESGAFVTEKSKYILEKLNKKITVSFIDSNGTRSIYFEYSVDAAGDIKKIKKKKNPYVVLVNAIFNSSPELKEIFGQLLDEIESFPEEVNKTKPKGETKSIKKDKKETTKEDKTKETTKLENKLEFARGKTFPIVGEFQGGKSNIMVDMSILGIANNLNVVIVLRNLRSDKNQLIGKGEKYAEKIYKHLDDNGISRKSFDFAFTTSDTYKPSTRPQIVLALNNPESLAKIKDLHEPMVFIDECDDRKEAKGDEKTKKGKDTASVELFNLQERSFCVFKVSATAMDFLYKEGIQAQDVILLNMPKNYMALNMFDFQYIEKECKFTSKKSESILENDLYMEEYLEYLVSCKPKRSFYKERHPINALMCVAGVLEPIYNFQKDLMKKEKLEKLATMTYSGEGVRLYHKSLANIKSIKLKNNESSTNKDGVHHFSKDVRPSNIYEYLKKNGGVEKYSHILTIALDSVCNRGISFGSNDYADCMKNNKLVWRLNYLYMTFPDGTSLPDILQRLARACGVFNGNVEVQVTVKEEIHDLALKAYYLNKELCHHIKRAEKEKLTKDILETRGISKKKIRYDGKDFGGRKFTKHVTIDFNQVSQKEDERTGGWLTDKKGNYEKLKIKINTEETENRLKIVAVCPKTKEGYVRDDKIIERAKKEKKEDIKEEPKTTKKEEPKVEEVDGKIDGVDLSKLRAWIKEDCDLLVGRMLRFLYKHKKQISAEDFISAIDYRGSVNAFQNNLNNGRGAKAQYGMIWICNNGMVSINPKIKQYLSSL